MVTDKKARSKSGRVKKRDYSQQIRELRPIDDDFTRILFKGDLKFSQEILRILTGIDDLVLTEDITQYDLHRLVGARSLFLDVLGTDSKGRKYNLEIQRKDESAIPQRARYHSSAMDVEFLNSSANFDDLPITYVIFITENDVRGEDRAVYSFEWVDTLSGRPLGDGAHIIFANAAYNKKGDDSDIAKLMHDFKCNEVKDMRLASMKKRTRYFKNNKKGVKKMCKVFEEVAKEAAKEAAEEATKETAENLLVQGILSKEDIASATKLTLEEVEEIAASLEE